jgi:glutathione S-transferase
MKFYDCQTAPSPRRVRIFIAEKGLDIPTVEVDMRNKEQLGEAFLKINPQATVPALTLDDGTTLVSTAGCRTYLEGVHPEPAMMGRNDAERGVVADLISKIESEGLGAVAECLRNTAKGMKGRALTGQHNYEQIPDLGARGKVRAERFYESLDSVIGDKAFLAGDAISAADIDAFIFCEFTQWIKVAMPDSCKNVARWHAAMKERPSAKL